MCPLHEDLRGQFVPGKPVFHVCMRIGQGLPVVLRLLHLEQDIVDGDMTLVQHGVIMLTGLSDAQGKGSIAHQTVRHWGVRPNLHLRSCKAFSHPHFLRPGIHPGSALHLAPP